MLILGHKDAPLKFLRKINFSESYIEIEDQINLDKNTKNSVCRCLIGDEIAFRYVPQSRYFQSQELETAGFYLDQGWLKKLNRNKEITITRKINPSQNQVEIIKIA